MYFLSDVSQTKEGDLAKYTHSCWVSACPAFRTGAARPFGRVRQLVGISFYNGPSSTEMNGLGRHFFTEKGSRMALKILPVVGGKKMPLTLSAEPRLHFGVAEQVI